MEGATAISYSSLLTAKRDWLVNNRINILAQHALKAHPQLPNVPVILDFAKTDDDRRLLEVVFARQAIGYPYAAPPGVPADRVEAIRKAFISSLADKALLADAERSGVEIDPVSGREVQELLERIYSTPPAILDRANRFMSPGPKSLCCESDLAGKPFLLERHRAGIAQRRMQPSMVVEGDPVHHLVLAQPPRTRRTASCLNSSV